MRMIVLYFNILLLFFFHEKCLYIFFLSIPSMNDVVCVKRVQCIEDLYKDGYDIICFESLTLEIFF